ncbi:hypothetical protein D6856_02035 [Butyrivibrio sp. XB500-5]|uniref:hypothetical protein n=1 Tax=Butyrivibrio sp. XB500-5 TaxID=2364880 RepID=UPI000EA84462|nr:hypothetical protein [Butyrivibrio sp. XB500-5]RKM62925.1 hypothetical protein D6856_02035 [Butyrivibrio sp. XB500-5]
MKSRKTVAILMASAMMLALMGCGSSEGEATDGADLNEVNVGISVDVMAPESEADSITDASTDASEAASGTTSAATSDSSFSYKGKVISILDDTQAVIDALGTPDDTYEDSADDNPNLGEKRYYYHLACIEVSTLVIDGKENLLLITIKDPEIPTPKGIKFGSSKDDVIAAYGEPTKESESGDHKIIEYEFDNYKIILPLSNKDTVDAIMYENSATHDMVSWS